MNISSIRPKLCASYVSPSSRVWKCPMWNYRSRTLCYFWLPTINFFAWQIRSSGVSSCWQHQLSNQCPEASDACVISCTGVLYYYFSKIIWGKILWFRNILPHDRDSPLVNSFPERTNFSWVLEIFSRVSLEKSAGQLEYFFVRKSLCEVLCLALPAVRDPQKVGRSCQFFRQRNSSEFHVSRVLSSFFGGYTVAEKSIFILGLFFQGHSGSYRNYSIVLLANVSRDTGSRHLLASGNWNCLRRPFFHM